MRVLVTGGTGFLGRHVVAELEHRGYQVFAPTSSDFDLRSEYDTRGALYTSHADAVVHLAAHVGGIGLNVAHPGQLAYENTLMGANILEQSRRAGIQKLLSVGTACMYPADAPMPLREEDLWNGQPALETLPYAEAKRALLVMGQAYRREYGFNAVFLIPTNLYGPGDNFDIESGHVVPGLIQRMAQAVSLGWDHMSLWGSGTATRDFLYVTDAARGIVDALQRYDDAEPVNLGSGVEVRIANVAQCIADIYGWSGTTSMDTERPSGTPRRVLDVTRAKDVLGWSATVPLFQGLGNTVEWYRSQLVAA